MIRQALICSYLVLHLGNNVSFLLRHLRRILSHNFLCEFKVLLTFLEEEEFLFELLFWQILLLFNVIRFPWSELAGKLVFRLQFGQLFGSLLALINQVDYLFEIFGLVLKKVLKTLHLVFRHLVDLIFFFHGPSIAWQPTDLFFYIVGVGNFFNNLLDAFLLPYGEAVDLLFSHSEVFGLDLIRWKLIFFCHMSFDSYKCLNFFC